MLDRETIGFIRYFVGQYRRRTVLLVLLLLLSGVSEGVGLVAMLPLLEMATAGQAHIRSPIAKAMEVAVARLGLPMRLEVMLGLIVLAMVLKGAFRLLAMRQVGYTVSRVATDLRLMMLRSLLHTRWAYFVSQPTGRFANAIGSETMRASAAYRSVCALLAALTQVVIYTVVAILVSWKLAALALAAGALVAAVLAPMVKRARTASRKQKRLMKSLTIRLTDALHGIKPIKAMGREEHLQPVLERETREINKTQEEQVWATESVAALQEPLLVALMAVVLYYTMAVEAQSFATMLVTVFVFSRLAGRMGYVQRSYQGITLGESAFWSVREAIELAEEQREPTSGKVAPPALEEGIVVEELTFAYGERMVLDRVWLSIPAGQFVTLVGPSGAGKTTLADIIVGLYSPQQGQILVDGVPLEQIDLNAWRQQIGYVPQEMFLFHDTLFQNLTLGDASISRSDVEEALQAAGAWEFVSKLPNGLDTVTGERGSKISGGQRQRIAIARALVRKPKLLVLDEVTTALDPRTEAAICRTLRKLRGDVTILSISHQPAMMEVADITYRIDGGNVRREELAAAGSV